MMFRGIQIFRGKMDVEAKPATSPPQQPTPMAKDPHQPYQVVMDMVVSLFNDPSVHWTRDGDLTLSQSSWQVFHAPSHDVTIRCVWRVMGYDSRGNQVKFIDELQISINGEYLKMPGKVNDDFRGQLNQHLFSEVRRLDMEKLERQARHLMDKSPRPVRDFPLLDDYEDVNA